MSKLPVVVIVGRPNVGKSSLFNRILGRRAAVVSDREGVTRDRHFQNANWSGFNFTLVDTGGYILDKDIDEMADSVRAQIFTALKEADVVLFMVDVRVGVTAQDLMFARLIQKAGVSAMLVANKGELPEDRLHQHEFLQLGFGDALPASALTGYGFTGLLEKITAQLPRVRRPQDEKVIRLAILGRPNAGKSTLLNKLIGEERVIVSDVAGTTRDSIDCEFVWYGKKFVITDTAGLRKKAKIHDEVEYFSSMRSIESIRRSDVCILMVDATRGVEEQDIRIIRQIQDQDKGILLILNKWDALESKTHKTFDEMVKWLRRDNPNFERIPIFSISALTGQRTGKIMETVEKVYQNMFRVLGQEQLVETFRQAVMEHPHPIRSQKNIEMKKACQVMVNPVVVSIECPWPELVDEQWKRYFLRRLHEKFDMTGAPLKVNFDKEFKPRKDEELAEYA